MWLITLESHQHPQQESLFETKLEIEVTNSLSIVIVSLNDDSQENVPSPLGVDVASVIVTS